MYMKFNIRLWHISHTQYSVSLKTLNIFLKNHDYIDQMDRKNTYWQNYGNSLSQER
jgi:hypothetical protein